MTAAAWTTLIALAIPAYAYAGYPIILFVAAAFVQLARDARYLLSRLERRRRSTRTPTVSIIVAAHNEETVIKQAIRNLLSLDYPADLIELIVGSDGSNDRTVQLAIETGDRRLHVEDFPDQRGKLAVLKDCAQMARGEILVFSDANTLLNRDAVKQLVRHFDDPLVGAVCGELRFTDSEGRTTHEGFYWRYELTLKMLESRIDSSLGANGAIYAVRTELFPDVPEHLITEDFVIPMRIRSRGFRVRYDPEAIAREELPEDARHEFRRRVRIGTGNWQALRYCAGMLLPWKGFAAFSFWSHKVLRWLTPFALPVALVANLFVLDEPFGKAALCLQVAFYLAAVAGLVMRRLGLCCTPCRIAWYFVLINAALAVGIVKGALGLQRAGWRPTPRADVRSEDAA